MFALLLTAGAGSAQAGEVATAEAALARVHQLQSRVEAGKHDGVKRGAGEDSNRLAAYSPELEFLATELGKLSELAAGGDAVSPAAIETLARRADRIARRLDSEAGSALAREQARRSHQPGMAAGKLVGPLTGRVVDQDSLNPLPGVAIRVFDANGNDAGVGLTNGNGDYSVIPSRCTTYQGGGVPASLPPSPSVATATFPLFVPGSGNITDVDVTGIGGTHTWVGDLRFELVSPAGTVVPFFSLAACGSSDDFRFSVNDQAQPAPLICPATGGATYPPNTGFQLSSFNGQNAQGTWTLRVSDVFLPADDGQLASWQLRICTSDDPELPLYVRTDSDLNPPYVDQLHAGRDCEPACDVLAGDPVSGIYSNINFTLSQGATISGTTIESGTGSPLSGVTVNVYDTQGAFLRSAVSDLLGTWQVRGLPDGSYFLVAIKNSAPTGVSHLNRLYANRDCAIGCDPVRGTPVATTRAAPATGIAIQLPRGAMIGGRVTDQATGNPLTGVSITIHDRFGAGDPALGGALETLQVDGNGQYLSQRGYTPGDYRVRTSIVPFGYVPELYQDLPCLFGCSATTIRRGSPVRITTAAQILTDVDFALSNQRGTIAGQVLDEGGQVVPGMSILAFDWVGAQVASTVSDGAGNFVLSNLPAGRYTLRSESYGPFVNQLYSGIPCPFRENSPRCDPLVGLPILVNAGATAGGVTLRLARGGRIEGKVTDSGFVPLPNVEVRVFTAARELVRSTLTNGSGDYVVEGLEAGNYKVVTANNSGLIDEIHADRPCLGSGAFDCGFAAAESVAVGLGSARTGINFVLVQGGGISGRVTDLANGAGLWFVRLDIFDAQGRPVDSVWTDGAGNYSTRLSGSGLTSGTYYVFAHAGWSGYVDEVYADFNCPTVPWRDVACDPTDGSPVSVTQPFVQGGVDLSLRQGGSISGALRRESTNEAVFAAARAYDATGREVASAPFAFGSYYIDGLPGGSFYVKAGEWNHQVEIFDDVPCRNFACAVSNGTPIQTFYAVDTDDKDFTLAGGGAITGMVYDGQRERLPKATVRLYNAAGTLVASRLANGQTPVPYTLPGYYEFLGLAPGTYYLVASAPGLPGQVYDGIDCENAPCQPTDGVPVSVSVDTWVGGINFTLGGARIFRSGFEP